MRLSARVPGICAPGTRPPAIDNEVMGSPDLARQLSRLRLEVTGGGRAVTILVDGQDLFAKAGNRAYAGFHPSEMLDPDAMILLPRAPKRRVAVYRCACGTGGCGCVAPFISQAGQLVRWNDFRDFTGVYDNPTVESNPAGGMVLPLPELVFDASQYQAEVERATRDRWWETPGLKVARLASSLLEDGQCSLADLGWRHEAMWPTREKDSFCLTFRDLEDNQLCVDMTARPGAPEDQAAELVNLLLTTTPEQWPVTACNLCDYDFEPSPGESWEDRTESLARHPAHGPAARSKLAAQNPARPRG